MTQRTPHILTGVAGGLFLFLSWAFADGLFSFNNLWNSDEISSSSIFTYTLLALIVIAGVRHAQTLTNEPASDAVVQVSTAGQIHDPVIWHRLIGNIHWAIIWLPVRFFVGREWLSAGEHKLRDSAWMDGGTALQGYWERATLIPDEGRPSITYGWYRDFIQYMLDNEWYTWFAKFVAIGEFVIGVALIVGALVGISAFLATFMNFNFQLAGTASTNPVLFGIGVLLVLAWKTAGYIGVDRYVLPLLGAPWQPGELFTEHEPTPRPGPA